MTNYINILDKYGFKVRELVPNDSHKSFYGKAKVITDGITEYLYSYNTPIMALYHGVYYRLWDGWTATTGRHIKAFSGLNKKQYQALPPFEI